MKLRDEKMPRIPSHRSVARWACLVAAAALAAGVSRGQGVLTLTPGRSVTTTAGTGALGYSGNDGAATLATLASPSAVVFDNSGNLYLADTANHVVREVVKSSGTVVTVAGGGIAGYAGDGGAATAALLDTPTGVAIDASGNLYIADSHNHCIRKVAAGVITTVAGTGAAGFSGDGAAATAAQLAAPQGVAVDAAGNLYIADTNNQRVRKVTGGTITTIAGTGEQSYSGDGGAATAAALDSPVSVAVSSAGVVYIADRHNQRVRAVSAAGVISTVAGSGTPAFAGGFSGDGAAATAASLSHPTGVSVDASGNIYIADTNNQRIRTITNGVVTSATGTGEQGFAGDGAALNSAVLNAPKAAVVDTSGNLAIADSGNARIRGAADAAIAFGAAAVGGASATQTIRLQNTGTASLSLSTVSVSGQFAVVTGGSCSAAPITLAAGESCTELMAFAPLQPGAATGSVAFSGPGAAPTTILLSGTGTRGRAAVGLASSASAPFVNQDITFTATVAVNGSISPTGTVSFYANGTLIGPAQTVTSSTATLTTNFGTAGAYVITAVYSGDANLTGAMSTSLSQLVGDFNFTITSDPTQGGRTVVPGDAATFQLTVAPLNGPFIFPIVLSATGLPPGASATFTPSTITLGANSVPFTMKIQTSAASSAVWQFRKNGGAPMLAIVLLPLAGAVRRRMHGARPLLAIGLAVLSLAALAGLSGCGTNSGFFGTGQKSYTINVIGTATGAQGSTLQRVTSVKLTVQ